MASLAVFKQLFNSSSDIFDVIASIAKLRICGQSISGITFGLGVAA